MAIAESVCESMPAVVGSAFRWTIIAWLYKHWTDVQFHITFSFLLKKWMIIRWLNTCSCHSNRPEVEKTIPFGATSVAGRPQRLGNVIIKLFKCQSSCFSVNPCPPAYFSGKMGTNTFCLFQETNCKFKLGIYYLWLLSSCSSKLVVILFLKLIIWIFIVVFGYYWVFLCFLEGVAKSSMPSLL